MTLDRLKVLAGIKPAQTGVIVLLPEGTPVEEMRGLLDKLKLIIDDKSKWNELEIDGQKYIGTGVVRDL